MNTRKNTLRMYAAVGIFSAIAVILQMMGSFIPKVSGFLEIELSDLPALVLAFAFGPLAGVLCELIKNLIHCFFTTTGFVGEFANFVINGIFCLVAGLVYQKQKTKMSAVVGLVFATLAMALAGVFINFFVMIPLYAPEMDAVAKTSLVTRVILPFNIARGVVLSAIVLLIYKKISPILHKKQ